MTQSRPASRLLAVAEVAHRLNLSTKSIRRRIARNELHTHRLGRVVRVSEEDLAAYLAKNRC